MFKPIINREEVLEELMKYSPGNKTPIRDIILRQNIEHVVSSYEDLDKKVKEKFPEDEVRTQYDILKMHVPLDEKLIY